MYSRTSNWRVNILLFTLFIRTIFLSTWKRKVKGFTGVLKYPWILFTYLVKVFLALLVFKWKAKMILLAYTYFRRVDDVMDGDLLLPKDYTTESYVEEKKNLISALLEGRKKIFLKEDLLLVYLLEEAEKRRISISSEIDSLWNVMYWDFQRSRSGNLTAVREGLNYFAEMQDSAILCATAKIFGRSGERAKQISRQLAGLFTKTDWIADMPEDIERGVINIPKDELKEYGIPLPELLKCKNLNELKSVPGFLSWYKDEAWSLDDDWNTARRMLGEHLNEFVSKEFQKSFLGKFFSLERAVFGRQAKALNLIQRQ